MNRWIFIFSRINACTNNNNVVKLKAEISMEGWSKRRRQIRIIAFCPFLHIRNDERKIKKKNQLKAKSADYLIRCHFLLVKLTGWCMSIQPIWHHLWKAQQGLTFPHPEALASHDAGTLFLKYTINRWIRAALSFNDIWI